MDSYPPEFIADVAPLAAVVGLMDPSSAPRDARELASGLRLALIEHLGTLPSNSSVIGPRQLRMGLSFTTSKRLRAALPAPPRSPASPPHQASILSPRCPESKLYPNGIILPQHISRYRDVLPAVVLMYCQLSLESGPASQITEDSLSNQNDESDADAIIVQAACELRNALLHTSCKLFICLAVLGTGDVDDDSITNRVTRIIKYANIDAKTVFLVSSDADLTVFVLGMKPILWMAATKYLAKKAADVRRRQSRISSSFPDSNSSSCFESQLVPLGWQIRYDFKLGFLAELARDYGEACKLYSNCYFRLVEYLKGCSFPSEFPVKCEYKKNLQKNVFKASNRSFSTTLVGVEVFDKRWFETKILLEVLSFKLIKIHLIQGNFSESAMQFKTHVKVLEALLDCPQNVPALSWLYYDWKARLFMAMGDLIDAMRDSVGMDSTWVEDNCERRLQHGGIWYYESIKFVRKRANKKTIAQLDSSDFSPPMVELVEAEQKVDLNLVCIQTLTRAYDLFKKSSAQNGTLYVAKEIAEIYYFNEDYSKALVFYERMAKSYRKRGWSILLASTLIKAELCAKKLGRQERQLVFILELLSLTGQRERNMNLTCDQKNIQQKLEYRILNREAIELVLKGVIEIFPATLEKSIVINESMSFFSIDARFLGARPLPIYSKLELFINFEQKELHLFSPTSLAFHFNDSRYDFVILFTTQESTKTEIIKEYTWEPTVYTLLPLYKKSTFIFRRKPESTNEPVLLELTNAEVVCDVGNSGATVVFKYPIKISTESKIIPVEEAKMEEGFISKNQVVLNNINQPKSSVLIVPSALIWSYSIEERNHSNLEGNSGWQVVGDTINLSSALVDEPREMRIRIRGENIIPVPMIVSIPGATGATEGLFIKNDLIHEDEIKSNKTQIETMSDTNFYLRSSSVGAILINVQMCPPIGPHLKCSVHFAAPFALLFSISSPRVHVDFSINNAFYEDRVLLVDLVPKVVPIELDGGLNLGPMGEIRGENQDIQVWLLLGPNKETKDGKIMGIHQNNLPNFIPKRKTVLPETSWRDGLHIRTCHKFEENEKMIKKNTNKNNTLGSVCVKWKRLGENANWVESTIILPIITSSLLKTSEGSPSVIVTVEFSPIVEQGKANEYNFWVHNYSNNSVEVQTNIKVPEETKKQKLGHVAVASSEILKLLRLLPKTREKLTAKAAILQSGYVDVLVCKVTVRFSENDEIFISSPVCRVFAIPSVISK